MPCLRAAIAEKCQTLEMLAHLLKISGEQFHAAFLHADCVAACVGGGNCSCTGLVDGDKRYGYGIGPIGLPGS